MSLRFMLAAMAMSAVAVAAAPASASASVLDAVKERGVLNCGTDNAAPGFGYLNTQTGKMEGMDIDLCRAVAAAVLGDAQKVKFVAVTDKSRFAAVQTSQVDVVFAHTTLYPSRESTITVDFLPINFYDGLGVMVKKADEIKKIDDLNGATICTTQGSGTETTLARYVKAKGWSADTKILTYDGLEKLFAALNSGRCVAMSTDKSALAAWKGNSPKPGDLEILPDVLDKSPFAGFVVANDSKWRNALRWIVFATIQAEEMKISSSSVDDALKDTDPAVQKFLGVGGSFGPAFGLPEDFVQEIIRAVGNYGEIYNRNIGPDTPYFIQREGTPNALWTNGGVLYSPPWL